ncbi:aldo/keto reductase [Histomonas meleagridis]|uniref:aldo/keto reductase n=1 Tax=Histomonas meleagridis TaxID=135588 RepID=UPI003559EA7D|nr:aldo/keto reductase [Histomonas meleagridis]KAH0802481.1 aldo/keto reductase [Histomonas meleagridis]
MQKAKLNNGVEIPLLGFGVYQIPDHDQCKQVVLDAIRTGYRLIDTAAVYLNEKAVGEAIKESGVPREELFITTKVWVQNAGYENTKKAFQASLDRLGLEYIDLYLIHEIFGDYYGSWRAMEELYAEGKIRAIGVSNFYPDRLVDLIMHNKIVPAVNQVECHPFFQKEDALSVMKEYGVQPEAWAPFAEGGHGFFTNPIMKKIADNHHKTVAQVALRWNIQRGVVVIPKTVHKNRMEENFDVWDFELTKEEMEEIATLDTGHSEILNHYEIARVKRINNYILEEHKL